jgi:hypothetical protein
VIRARLVSATGEPPGPAEKAVKTRHETLDALTDSGMLKDAVTAATHLSAASTSAIPCR